MASEYLPIGISLKNKTCLVVGGGEVAERKIDTLLEYDSTVTVVAPETTEKIAYWAERSRIELHKRGYESPEASKYGLVISACDDAEVNKAVYADAHAASVPVNVVDNPPLCDFIFPATLKRDCLSVTVSSDGKAPFLSRYLRLVLEEIFPERWNKIAKYAGEFREMVMTEGPKDQTKKTIALDNFLAADWPALVKKDVSVVESEMRGWLSGEPIPSLEDEDEDEEEKK